MKGSQLMKRSWLGTTFVLIALTLTMQTVDAQTMAAAAPATRHVAPAAASQPFVPENPAVTRRALDWVGRFQTTNIDRTQLSPVINEKLTPAVLAAMKRQLAPLGTPTGIAYGGARNIKGDYVYRYVVVFPIGAIQEFMSIDATGKIAGVLFLPVR